MDGIIKKYESVALSNYDILKMLDNRCNIVLYPNLHRYCSIDQLLGPYEACVLLFESKPRYGHWVALIKHGNDIEFFNSYGGFPDDSLRNIDKRFAIQSNQDTPYLSLLLLKCKYNLFYNEFKFQKKNNDTKTCGRHCVVRVLNKHMDIYKYKAMLDKIKTKYGFDYDEIVTFITENI